MKIGYGLRARVFGIILTLILVLVLSLNFMLKQVDKRDELIIDLTDNYQPSLILLSELHNNFTESQKIFRYMLVAAETNKQFFNEEFSFLYSEVLPSISNSLIMMSDHWPEEDQKVITETVHLISDSLYFHLLDFTSSLPLSAEHAFREIEEIELMLAESGIIFLISEIEQNTNYLLDKRNQEIASISGEITIKNHEIKKLIIIIPILSGVFLIFIFFYLSAYLRKLIGKLTFHLDSLAKGKIPEKITVDDNNEFSIIAARLNSIFDYLDKLTLIVGKISKKDFSTNFEPLSEEDELGKAVANLQEDLKKADAEERKYKKEEKERLWKSNSIAKINDILRARTDNPEDLGFMLVKEIVNLIDASVAGLFIVEGENEPHIILLAAYAYDRNKYMKKTIKPGEGLIGRCVQENEIIYLTDVPRNHINILTGLGETEPISLLIVPLQLKNKVYGVIEIASLREIDSYKINFIETIAENIATAISNLHTNIQTSRLLEQTRQQTEKMQSQEEIMRLHLKEMKLKQEKFAEREKELHKEIEKLKKEKKNTD